MSRIWDNEELIFLRKHYKTMSYRQIAKILKRTYVSINIKCSKLKLQKQTIPTKGDRYTSLTVIKKSRRIGKNGNSYYFCSCDCGKIVEVAGNNLRTKHTRSCGCIQRKEMGECSYNTLENICKKGAKRRRIKYSLTKEHFRELINKNCYFCGSKPRAYNVYYKLDGTKSASGRNIIEEWAQKQTVYINGIDRKDNNLGYIVGNCVPCCADCNEMKMNRTEEEFISQIERIHKYQLTSNNK